MKAERKVSPRFLIEDLSEEAGGPRVSLSLDTDLWGSDKVSSSLRWRKLSDIFQFLTESEQLRNMLKGNTAECHLHSSERIRP